MREIELFNSLPIVSSYEILDFKQGSQFYYLKVKVKLTDGSTLQVRMFVSDQDYNYSYHWQNENEKLIIRWDNSPHHPELETFPHHKHINNEVAKSLEISLEEVLLFIQKRLNKNGS